MGSVIGWWAESFASVAARVGKPSAHMIGDQPTTTSVSAVMQKLRSNSSVSVPPNASIATLMSKPAAAIIGRQETSGVVAAALPKMASSIGLTTGSTLALAAMMPKMSAIVSAAQNVLALFEAIGGGGSATLINSTASASFTMNVTRATTRIFALFQFAEDNTTTGYGATVGGQAMTLVTPSPFSHTAFQNVLVYEYINPAYGVTGHVEGTSTACVVYGGGWGNTTVIGNMIAYENCLSRGTMLTTSGTGTAATHSTAASTDGTLLFQAFLFTAAGTASGYNGTARFPGSATDRIIGGEILGSTSNVTFSATVPSGSWGSIIIPLYGGTPVSPPSGTVANPLLNMSSVVAVGQNQSGSVVAAMKKMTTAVAATKSTTSAVAAVARKMTSGINASQSSGGTPATIAMTNLANLGSTSSFDSSWVTPSITIPAGDVFVFLGGVKDSGTATFTATNPFTVTDSVDGATGWVQVGWYWLTGTSSYWPCGTLWRKRFSASSTRTITAASTRPIQLGYDIVSVTGLDATTPVVQSNNAINFWDDGTDAHSQSITLGATPAVGNAVLWFLNANRTSTADAATLPSGLTSLANPAVVYQPTAAGYKLTPAGATYNCTDIGTAVYVATSVAIELKAASS